MMPQNPKIKFKISPNKDFFALNGFISDASFDGGQNLNWAIFSVFPKLKKFWVGKNFTLPAKQLKDFIKKQHAKKSQNRCRKIKQYQKAWQKSANHFFQFTEKLFPNTSWPKGKYIAYATIWGMFPRYLEDKTFLIPDFGKNNQELCAIIAHEMLHFIYYSQLFKKFPYLKSKKNAFWAWNITEIFNAIIQNTDDWQKIFGHSQQPYPEHQKVVSKIEKQNKPSTLTAEQLTKIIINEQKK